MCTKIILEVILPGFESRDVLGYGANSFLGSITYRKIENTIPSEDTFYYEINFIALRKYFKLVNLENIS